MGPQWMFWLSFVLVAGSAGYELATGVSKVRGVGRYTRQDSPKQYWSWVAFKALFAAGLLAGALLSGGK